MDLSQRKQEDELLQLVTFSIGEEEFGVNILKVQEIIRTMEITRVPRAPEFVEGVINLRGKVIPIIDLRRRFGLAPKAHDKNTRIIVIEINNIIGVAHDLQQGSRPLQQDDILAHDIVNPRPLHLDDDFAAVF